MRFIVRAIIPTEAGNRSVKDPNFIKKIQGFMENSKSEAAYFTELNGDRTCLFFIDMPSVDMMLVIAEPLFQMGAKVEFHPAMNMEEIRKGLSAAIR